MKNVLKAAIWTFLFILALPILVILAGVLLAVICAILAVVFTIGLVLLPFALIWYLLT